MIKYGEIHEEFNKINVFWIAHTEQEISAIIQTSVEKTCFLKPSHNIIVSIIIEMSNCMALKLNHRNSCLGKVIILENFSPRFIQLLANS